MAVGQRDRRRRLVVAFALPEQHVRAVAGEGEFGERAGKARTRLDQRDQRARREIDALEHPLPEMTDFAHQPVILVGVEEMLVGDDFGRIARGLEDDRGDVKFVEPDVEDRVVEFARELERPKLRAERHHGVGRCGRRRLSGPRNVDRGDPRRARSNSTQRAVIDAVRA